jgi:hypothetical protein
MELSSVQRQPSVIWERLVLYFSALPLEALSQLGFGARLATWALQVVLLAPQVALVVAQKHSELSLSESLAQNFVELLARAPAEEAQALLKPQKRL